jgi:NADH-quinone oxidoreductase subunit L
MFLGVGVGAYTAGVFHLMTHAFFKGLMFLGAGSVIHALHERQDIRQMGGLAKKIPITFWTFAAGWAAIIGLPPLSGFFSKDEILWKTLEHGYPLLYVCGLVAAFLTAIYMTRLFYLTFLGKSRVDEATRKKIHESPLIMTVPLGILAFFSIVAGFWGLPHYITHFAGHNVLERFLDPAFAQAVVHEAGRRQVPPFGEGLASFFAVTIAAGGAYLAYHIYAKKPELADKAARLQPFYAIFSNKYYLDEIYQNAIVKPLRRFAEAGLWQGVDVLLIDGFLNGLGRLVNLIGAKLRLIQTGQARAYALSIAVAVALLLGYYAFLARGGF